MRAIGEAERATSGEIRVHIETSCKADIFDEAAWLFRKLGMHKTAGRNGVLIYMALRQRTFAIIGDTGINSVVGQGFWDTVRDHIQERFSQGHFSEGLVEGILMAGARLKEYFPWSENDINELPDDISFDATERGE